MSVVLDITYPPRFDVLFKAEPSESMIAYCYPGAIEGGFVDGISFEIVPETGKPWFASFAKGEISPNAVSAVLTMPDRISVLAISSGEAYIVDTRNPQKWEHLTLLPVMGWGIALSRELILLWDFSRVAAYSPSGLAWKTPSISWDGVANDSIEENEAVFKIWDAPTEMHQLATIDLRSGAISGGASPDLLDI